MRAALRWLPVVVFVTLALLFASRLADRPEQTVRSRLQGQALPAFALAPQVPGKPGLKSADYRMGRPRLLNVFGSWCVPCAAEAPQLLRLKAAGVPVDAIAIRDTPADVTEFLQRHGDPYVAIGSDRDSAVQLSLGSAGVPETFVIDGRGRIAYQHVGAIRDEDVAVLTRALEAAR